MKPGEFKEQNVVFAKNQPEYLPLPAHRDEAGTVTSFWRFQSWRELWQAIRHRGVYVSVMTFNRPLQPLLVATEFDPPKQ